ncbi:MAG: SAP domain-containing protein [Sterolibacterium sp.]
MLAQKELVKLAKKFHVSTGGLSKTELIRKFQLSEGNFDCYARASNGMCDQAECLWRDDCLHESAEVA